MPPVDVPVFFEGPELLVVNVLASELHEEIPRTTADDIHYVESFDVDVLVGIVVFIVAIRDVGRLRVSGVVFTVDDVVMTVTVTPRVSVVPFFDEGALTGHIMVFVPEVGEGYTFVIPAVFHEQSIVNRLERAGKTILPFDELIF